MPDMEIDMEILKQLGLEDKVHEVGGVIQVESATYEPNCSTEEALRTNAEYKKEIEMRMVALANLTKTEWVKEQDNLKALFEDTLKTLDFFIDEYNYLRERLDAFQTERDLYERAVYEVLLGLKKED